MVAINPKKNLHFGENPPEINLNSNLIFLKIGKFFFFVLLSELGEATQNSYICINIFFFIYIMAVNAQGSSSVTLVRDRLGGSEEFEKEVIELFNLPENIKDTVAQIQYPLPEIRPCHFQ